jgi:hypothetical protein
MALLHLTVACLIETLLPRHGLLTFGPFSPNAMPFKFWHTTRLTTGSLLLVCCGEATTQQPPSSRPAASHARAASVSPAEVVSRFYQWYLRDVYLQEPGMDAEGPRAVPSKNGRYYLDTTKHRAFLRKSGYFSPHFYANEQMLFESCNHQLRQVSAQQVQESGGFAGDLVDGPACDFLRWMTWTGGQGESLNTVKIKKSTLLADSAVVVAALGDSASGVAYEHSHPRVTLVKEKGNGK